jgi:hypothetical protein
LFTFLGPSGIEGRHQQDSDRHRAPEFHDPTVYGIGTRAMDDSGAGSPGVGS